MLAVWKVADDIELFESAHELYPIFSAHRSLHGGLITLTALAQATTRLRMGTLVTGIQAHPVIANMATTLDMSGGALGIGPAGTRRSRVPTGSSRARRPSAATAC